jgi:hypothetical protein
MEPSSSWEATGRLGYTRISQGSLPCSQEHATDPYPAHMNPIHITPSYFSKILFNIVKY